MVGYLNAPHVDWNAEFHPRITSLQTNGNNISLPNIFRTHAILRQTLKFFLNHIYLKYPDTVRSTVNITPIAKCHHYFVFTSIILNLLHSKTHWSNIYSVGEMSSEVFRLNGNKEYGLHVYNPRIMRSLGHFISASTIHPYPRKSYLLTYYPIVPEIPSKSAAVFRHQPTHLQVYPKHQRLVQWYLS